MRRFLSALSLGLLITGFLASCAGTPASEKARSGSASLKDDYYEYINARVISQKKIRPGQSSWTYYDDIDQRIYGQLNGILDNALKNRKSLPAASAERRIANLYLCALDAEGRDKAGLGAAGPLIEAVQNASDIPSYLAATADASMHYGFGGGLLRMSISPDSRNATRSAVWIGAPDMGPGKAILEDPDLQEAVTLYQNMLAGLLLQNGFDKSADEAGKDAAAVMALEKDIAASAFDLATANNPQKTYNLYTAAEIRELLPHFNIPSTAARAGIPEQPFYIVSDPAAMKKADSLLKAENLPLLKKYTTCVMLLRTGPYLSLKTADLIEDLYNAVMGIEEKKTREVTARESTQSLLNFEFGRIYVGRYFPESSKKDVENMTRTIMDVYRKRIDGLDWMQTATKEAAKRKLDTMEVHVGYPDKWPDYRDSAQIIAPDEGGCYIDNVLALWHAEAMHELDSLGKPVERGYWSMPPQEVNAYYNPEKNEIVLPAGILQAPFYDPGYTNAQNLGGTGQTIGHELSHAFDSSGAQYDEYGNLRSWWTEEDYRQFKEKGKKISDYYSSIIAIDNIYIKGDQTLDENTADLAGLEVSIAPLGSDPKVLREYFEIYAQAWACKMTDKFFKLALNTDVHSPFKARCNEVLKSSPEFYIAYPEIKEGDGMYLAPEKRIGIW